MRVAFDDGERAALIARWGLPDGATDDQIADLVITRLTTTQRPVTARAPSAPSPTPPAEAEQLVQDAIKAGKFPPERASYWLKRLQRNSADADFARLAPVAGASWLMDSPWAGGEGATDDYPREWLGASEPADPLDRAQRDRQHQYARRSRVTMGDDV
jgi:hypothetical protein